MNATGAPKHVGMALLAAASTALPFAVGIIKNGLLEVLLLAPVVWFLVASRTRDGAERVLLLLVSLCLTLTVCDLALRPVITSRLHYSPMNQHQRRLPALPMLGRWDALVDVSRSVYGDLAAMAGVPAFREPRVVEFRTDSLGFRNDSMQAPVDTIVLGDSFAAGVGVTQSGTFAQTLATRYGRSVYNLSYPGGPYDQYVNFSIEVSKLAIVPGAQLIWTLYTGNDLDDAGGETWEIGALPWRTGFSAMLVDYRTFRDRSPLRQIQDALWSRWRGISKDVLIRSLPDGRPVLFYGPQEVWGDRARAEAERHPNFPKLLKTLRAMKEAVTRNNVRATIMILPTKGEVYRWLLNPRSPDEVARPSGFSEAVLDACQQLTMHCLDSAPFLREEAKRLFAASSELLWWRDDTHMNEQGHRALASFLLQEILQPVDGGG